MRAGADDSERHLAATRQMLDSAWEIPLNPSGRSPFIPLAQSLARSLSVTYCRFAVREGAEGLRLRASAGHRILSQAPASRSVSLKLQPHARQALRDRRSVAVEFPNSEDAVTLEQEILFTRSTRRVVLIPFSSDRIEGLLLVGEERASRGEPFEGEHLASLEFVAHRIGDILRMGDLIRRSRRSERGRQIQTVKRMERDRLARELHDVVGQSLTSLLIRLRLARSKGGLTMEEINVLELATQDALDSARSVAYDLRRPSSGDAFQKARDYAETILGATGCRMTWNDRRGELPVSSRKAAIAALVIKESVTNIARHAQAGSAEITVEQLGRRLRVTIIDDGRGFLPGDRTERGLGLPGSRERLAQLGGSFRVESVPGVGTSVTFELP